MADSADDPPPGGGKARVRVVVCAFQNSCVWKTTSCSRFRCSMVLWRCLRRLGCRRQAFRAISTTLLSFRFVLPVADVFAGSYHIRSDGAVGPGMRLNEADAWFVVAHRENWVLKQFVGARLVSWVPACSNFDRALLGGSEQEFLPFAKGVEVRSPGIAVGWDAGAAGVADFTPAKVSVKLRGVAGAEHLLIIPAFSS